MVFSVIYPMQSCQVFYEGRKIVDVQELPEGVPLSLPGLRFRSDRRYFGWDDAEYLYEQEDEAFLIHQKPQDKKSRNQPLPSLAGKVTKETATNIQAAQSILAKVNQNQ